jgi:DNA-binding MurR/RpiR family transcriptional regulator
MRSSYAPAFLLNHYLNHIGIPSELLDYQAGRLIDRVIHIGPQNVVIGISFPRYFRETVEVLHYAKSKRAKTIVITDTLFSPGAHEGEVVITAKYHTPIPFLSYVSTLSLINCLVFGIIMKRKNQSVALVAEIEQMLEEWKSCLAMDG